MLPKCDFKHNGKPTTMPGTETDAKRIALSAWITAMLVFNGDEQAGEYQTPGANGYEAWEVAEARKRLVADKPKSPKEKVTRSRTPPVGKRVRPRKIEPLPEPTPPPVSYHDEHTLLAERLHGLGRQIFKLKKQIDLLAKPDEPKH